MTFAFREYLIALGILLLGITSGQAACYPPDQQLSPQTVSDFLSDPGQLLKDPALSGGGEALTNRVRDLLASNPATLAPLVALLKSANSPQQTAIGSGMGGAANLCLRPDPAFAADIQTQLAGSDSDFAKTAYAAVTGNNPIRSVAGGGGVSGGSVGGSVGGPSTPTFTSAFQPFSSSGTPTAVTNFFTGGGAGSAGSASSTTTTANSVSP